MAKKNDPPKAPDISYHGLKLENADLRKQLALATRTAMNYAEEAGRLRSVNENLQADNDRLEKRLNERSRETFYGVAVGAFVIGCALTTGAFWASQSSPVLVPGNCDSAIAAVRQQQTVNILTREDTIKAQAEQRQHDAATIFTLQGLVTRKDHRIATLIEQDHRDRQQCEDTEATEHVR